MFDRFLQRVSNRNLRWYDRIILLLTGIPIIIVGVIIGTAITVALTYAGLWIISAYFNFMVYTLGFRGIDSVFVTFGLIAGIILSYIVGDTLYVWWGDKRTEDKNAEYREHMKLEWEQRQKEYDKRKNKSTNYAGES